MFNFVLSESIIVDGKGVKQLTTYVYLGHQITNGRDNQTCEIIMRIGVSWTAFGKHCYVFKSNIPVCLKRKVYDQCVLPVLTYEADTLTLTKTSIKKIRVTQTTMERSMLGISL